MVVSDCDWFVVDGIGSVDFLWWVFDLECDI